jgi:HD-GYP domain-containing protein (c-di-GMP phosphodiesterase class II)
MRLSLKARAFVGGTVALGFGAVTVAAFKVAAMPVSTLALLGAAVALTELFLQVSPDESSVDATGGSTFSFSSGVHIAAILMLGPWAGAIVGAFGVLAVDPLRGAPWRRTFFNSSVFALATVAGGYVFQATGGHPGQLAFPAVLLPIAALTLTYTALNTVLVSCAVAFTSSASVWALIRQSLETERSPKVAEAGFGAALATFGIYEPWAVVVLAPLLIAVYQAHARLTLLRGETARALETFANIVDERDPYTYRHSARVADYVTELATALGLSDRAIARLRWAGRLHDLGKISVDAGVLRKPGRLDEDEWAAMRRHPRLSARLLRRFRFASWEAQAVEYHHERYDGTGYYGIATADLPLASHFLIVADSFDAMTSDRPYRQGLSREQALEEIERGLGTQFHPTIGAAFVAMQRGIDPLTVLGAQQLLEVRRLSTIRDRSPLRPRLAFSQHIEVGVVGAAVAALGAIAFHVYAAAVGAVVLGFAMLVRSRVRRLRASRLEAGLREQLAVSAPRKVHFDAIVTLLARRADLRWAGLLDWRESEVTGSIALERSIAEGPTDVALTSWLIREAEAGGTLLVADGPELGREGLHVALPLRGSEELQAFLALTFARTMPSDVELALRAVLPELARTLGPSGPLTLADVPALPAQSTLGAAAV